MSKKLVAYFSASGVTANIASKIAKAAKADLFEIVPAVKYTQEDLNFRDRQSRSSVEMADRKYRPPLAPDCKVKDMAQYDIIFLGFPIWWYVAPTIVNTFLEQYDLTGKKIILFATSDGNGMGKSMEGLKPSAPGAEFVLEKKHSSASSDMVIRSWVESLDI